MIPYITHILHFTMLAQILLYFILLSKSPVKNYEKVLKEVRITATSLFGRSFL